MTAPTHAAAEIAADAFRVPLPMLYSPNQARRFCRVRWAAMWAARGAGKTLEQIGRALERDEATVRNGIQRAEQMRAADPAFRAITDDILQRIGG